MDQMIITYFQEILLVYIISNMYLIKEYLKEQTWLANVMSKCVSLSKEKKEKQKGEAGK